MNMRFNLNITILVTGIFMSCTESTEDNYDDFSGSSSVGQVWRLSSIEVELGTLTPYQCVADNNYTYYSSGRYEVNEGRTKCSERDSPGLSGNYFLNDERTELTITIGDSVRVWDVVYSTNTMHKISSDFDGEWRRYVFELAQ